MNNARLLLGALIATLIVSCSAEHVPIRGEIELNSLFNIDFDLIDHFGEPANANRFAGKPMIIYFGFTACPDVCPAALGGLTASLDRLGNDASKVQAIFITVDPKRDNADRLRQHLAYDKRILGLTGTPAALKAARDGLKVYAAEMPMPESAMGYTVDHQRMFYITDKSGTPVIAAPDSIAPKDIATLVRQQL